MSMGSKCLACHHFLVRKSRQKGRFICEAFPEGIPFSAMRAGRDLACASCPIPIRLNLKNGPLPFKAAVIPSACRAGFDWAYGRKNGNAASCTVLGLFCAKPPCCKCVHLRRILP